MAAPLRAGSSRRSSARRQPLLRPDDALARALRAPSERARLEAEMRAPDAPAPEAAPTEATSTPATSPEVVADLASPPPAADPEPAEVPVVDAAPVPPPVDARATEVPDIGTEPAPAAPPLPLFSEAVSPAPARAPETADRPDPSPAPPAAAAPAAAAPTPPVTAAEATAPAAPEASATTAPETAPAPIAAAPAGPEAQLDMALTDLAEVFAVYPFRSGMPACAHCVSDDDLRLLGRAPGRIPGSVLDRYVTKSMITWGDAVDFKHLLPEILRRTCDGDLDTPEALVGARLRRAGWLEWPAAEAPAVRRTLRAAWLTTLAGAPAPGRTLATTRLGLIVSSEDDLSPYLDLWEDRLESPGDPTARLHAVLHLAGLLAPLAQGGRRRLARSYPLARRGVVGQLDQWLRLPVVVRRLAHAADALADTPQGAQIARAREGLARLKTDR